MTGAVEAQFSHSDKQDLVELLTPWHQMMAPARAIAMSGRAVSPLRECNASAMARGDLRLIFQFEAWIIRRAKET
jgi:hypothetical protein